MPLPTWLIVFITFQILISVVVIVFNGIGIYLLQQPNTFQYNQKLYLFNLSLIKTLLLFAQNVPLFLYMMNVRHEVIECMWLTIICLLVVPWCNVLLMLTVDRFIQVYNLNFNVPHTGRGIGPACCTNHKLLVSFSRGIKNN